MSCSQGNRCSSGHGSDGRQSHARGPAAVATWRQRFARREAAVVAKVFDAWRQFVGHRAVSRRLERRASIVGLEGADWLERPPVEGGDASLEALREMGLAA